ncbi:poly(A) polymerase [Angomonas deanei]|uniref:polynucleotide adenylyltransferase n=1 Tax=Angomonas deanei TaxID=59799 RepID=A0A7G2CI66_9TRYP|nr:poly(A) polymerase [Angomonas deanei]CAD2218651.1 Poly(A) polymerase central domain containing protein, putative [Angomonas deanei]|eukprot:EPY29788.1 poly(A) polymerase [Angomonas deanei]
MVLCSFTVPVQTIVNHFVDRLKASVPDGVMVVDSAKVPVLKFVYHSFPVDIVLVSVVAPSAPSETEMLSNDFLDRIVIESRGNVNGIRTVLQIRRLVPTPLPVFSVVLKAVKLWARARRVYGHLFTYPNGVALAIMVSRVCQVCPSSQISDLFKFFFKFYFSWFSKTDHIYPVYITPSLATGQQRYAGMPSSFDPTNPRCQEDVLPVINPAFPYVNACHTVGKSGLRCFYMELSRAHSILLQETDSLAVRSLMQPIELSAIPFFLLVHVPCYCRGLAECEWNLKLWKGFVESKFRF